MWDINSILPKNLTASGFFLAKKLSGCFDTFWRPTIFGPTIFGQKRLKEPNFAYNLLCFTEGNKLRREKYRDKTVPRSRDSPLSAGASHTT